MNKDKKIKYSALIFLILTSFSIINVKSINVSSIQNSGFDYDIWHMSDNLTTDYMDISYKQISRESVYGDDYLQRSIEIKFLDGTNSQFSYAIDLSFNDTGVDLENHAVLDWSKYNGISQYIETETGYGNLTIDTRYLFYGMAIGKGNASQIALGNYTWTNELGDDCWQLGQENESAFIDYGNKSVFGEVIYETYNYTYENQEYKDIMIYFNVTMDGQIGFENQMRYLPIIMPIQIHHNVTETSYKYGFDMDFSEAKDFSTNSQHELSDGDEYFLLQTDKLSVWYSIFNQEDAGPDGDINQFSSNENNDIAEFNVNGIPVYQHFPTYYKLDNETSERETTRLYYEIGSKDPVYFSTMFLLFDGFKYNQTSRFYFDPKIIVPNILEKSSNIPGFSFYPLISALFVSIFLIKIRLKKNLN
ncbi:hypothetical protein DSAG12_00063 [Promethearchaeum syntrophicum]|uniref:Uncharacterized protein n=1 Tax=Promethearchaeum syntrophicum TaxID=2594042 RepID=A0A5B9D5B7_9ARCH|nr:hypothetical protein [Candidatus Prometheoarchaeum syntrophicum]QEE14252.1 hypothetical protein DSAG12_00063 [Candidatus Prometheoarchaeum syntrophicum]